MRKVLWSGGTCCCEAFICDVACCLVLLTAKPNHFSLCEISVVSIACDTHSSQHGWFGWSITGLAVFYVPRHAVKMGCQCLPWKFSIAELMPGCITEFYLLGDSVPHWACRDGLSDPTELLPSKLQESRKCVSSFMRQLFPALVFGSVGQVEEER